MRSTDSNKENPWSLFGVDLRQLGSVWSTGWRELRQTRLLSWLEPRQRVWLNMPSGAYALYDNGQIKQAVPKLPLPKKQFVAVVVPDGMVLAKKLTLPRLSPAEIEQMLMLDISTSSPFGAERTAWAWSQRICGRTTTEVSVAFADREELHAYHQQHELDHPNHQIELWHLAPDANPVVFSGFGEAVRKTQEHRHRLSNYLLLMFVFILALAASLTPVLNNYFLLQSARAEVGQMQQQSADALEARNRWLNGVEVVEELTERTKTYPNPMLDLELISEVLPDNTYLERLELREQGVRLTGYSQNATALVDQLGDYPYITDTNLPTGINRDARTGLDNFTLHFRFED